ncbi:trypsin-like peptidase domain-containing protein [Haloferula sp.]|uniref:trypsin-like peptidase domain-containing protein n=1 Tax=Haloferula sp. TaxID=2497595 RepID=UPI00329BBAFC
MTEGIRRLFTLITVFLVMFAAVYLIRNGPAGFRQLFEKKEQGRDFRPEHFSLPDKAPLELGDVELLSRLNDEYAMLTDAVVPSVVSIDTSGVRAQRLLDGYGRQHFRAVPTQGQGSGVIVSHEGHVVTNYHVVKGQRQIQVTMHDGPVLPATLIDEDPVLDIAVLKIESEGPFQPLKFGDSDEVRRGQITFAYGNPFGLGETVTQGIISAVERSLSDTQRDLIQTDAAINPGNSGGPLVNLQGEIIGINSAIYRPDERVNSGFQGVGFSIPSNDVKEALFTILERGRPIRGYLGVQVDPNPLAKEALGYGDPGVLIGAVRAGSPAEKAGLEVNDVVVRYAGEKTENMTALFTLVQRSRVGREVPIEVWRDGELLNFKARIVERQADLGFRAEPNTQGRTRDQDEVLRDVGVLVRDLTPAEVKAGYRGVVVVEVSKGGLAERKMAMGDLIETVNQFEVSDSSEFYERLAASAAAQATTLQLVRQGKRGRVMLPALPRKEKETKKSEDPADSVDGATSGR